MNSEDRLKFAMIALPSWSISALLLIAGNIMLTGSIKIVIGITMIWMIITGILMIWSFGGKREREVHPMLLTALLEKKIADEAREKYQKLYNQLTEKEKKKVNKIQPLIMFPNSAWYHDWKSRVMQKTIDKRNKR